MKLIRSLAACCAVTLVFSLTPGIAPRASAAGTLVTSPATVPATPGQTLALAALFQQVRVISPSFQYVSVVVTLTGGLTFPDGGQTLASEGAVSLPSVLGVPVTVKGFGTATLKVIAQDNNARITDEASTAVDVPAPLPGTVRLLTTVGTASAKAGQSLPIGSLFKAVDIENRFNLVKTIIEVTLTGGVVFAAKLGPVVYGPQFTRYVISTSVVYPHSRTMNDVLLFELSPNSSGTVTLKVTARTATFDITDEATAAVNVPTPGPAPAPPTPVTAPPTPVTVPLTPAAGAPAAGAVNRAPVAESIQLIATAGVATPLLLKASDPDGNALTYVLVQLPSHGKLSGQAPALSYTPDSGFLGTDALIFTAGDASASSGQATVTINVTGKAASIAKTVRKVVKKTVKKTVKKR